MSISQREGTGEVRGAPTRMDRLILRERVTGGIPLFLLEDLEFAMPFRRGLVQEAECADFALTPKGGGISYNDHYENGHICF